MIRKKRKFEYDKQRDIDTSLFVMSTDLLHFGEKGCNKETPKRLYDLIVDNLNDIENQFNENRSNSLLYAVKALVYVKSIDNNFLEIFKDETIDKIEKSWKQFFEETIKEQNERIHRKNKLLNKEHVKAYSKKLEQSYKIGDKNMISKLTYRVESDIPRYLGGDKPLKDPKEYLKLFYKDESMDKKFFLQFRKAKNQDLKYRKMISETDLFYSLKRKSDNIAKSIKRDEKIFEEYFEYKNKKNKKTNIEKKKQVNKKNSIKR